ncbi:conserved protein of unknown function [Nitrospira japonica]|uniref:AraC effector-binding domain-containing protein n=1 Tax=Nitrospira japonica TaxID=1325564 RepID=A0A1W1IAK0_9BACT|nr:GyrI-like domain-containing protein [Nitrospira japonica]SLM49941.1 conserved protein of unknown function [Nitrospira japonica]
MTQRPNVTDEDEIRIVGIEVRTSNRLESDRKTARIPGLWQRFYREHIEDQVPHRVADEFIYEAYIDYGSDHNGEYSVVLGVQVDSFDNVPPGMARALLPRSRYLVFPAVGEIPKAVQHAWGNVWNHFTTQAEHRRSFRGDYEKLKKDDKGGFAECNIYISVV